MKRASRAELLLSPLIPHRFIAAQLRQPSGPFGRLIMTRVLNRGNAELISATIDALTLTRSDAFMDAGFGGGLGLQLAAARTEGPLWGVDFSADVVLAAKATATLRKLIAAGRLNVICADVEDLPLRDGLVQAICTTNTIYFWRDPTASLRSLRRVLSAGGRLALGFSGASKMREYGKVTTHGFTLYEPERVEALVREVGFSKVQMLPQNGQLSRGDFVCLAS